MAVSTRITDAGRYDQALTAIAQGTVPAIGSDFFHSLVRHLAVALEVRYVFVTECLDEEKTKARSLAFWSGDGFEQNFEYDTAPTHPAKKR